MDFSSLAFVDIETTGTSHENDRIIEIGVLRVQNGEVIETFSSLINPQVEVPDFIQRMTGIDTNLLHSAPLFSEVADTIFRLVDTSVFVAHNVGFDYSFLKSEFSRLDRQFLAPRLCTVKLSRTLYPQYQKHGLDTLMERFNFIVERRHRAMDDAHAVWQFYQMIQKQFPSEELQKTLHQLTRHYQIPKSFSADEIDRLPTGPGIYIFYDINRHPLYIGKSNTVRERVLAHFSDTLTSDKEMDMAQQVHYVEAISTIGELGAELLEVEKIKQLKPIYNKKMRKKSVQYVLIYSPDDEGYYHVRCEEVVSAIPSEMLNSLLGIYTSKAQAKNSLIRLCATFSLCPQFLGLEKRSASCFAHKSGRCNGACVGIEKPQVYNRRMLTAFSRSRIMRWPYQGMIVVKEQSSDKNIAYIFKDWIYLGTIEMKDQAQELNLFENTEFDYNLYSILKNFLVYNRQKHAISNISDKEISEMTK
ncbi:MAG: exonuclease domain-containing protein [Candidatus Roizmanbacteria bacterium]